MLLKKKKITKYFLQKDLFLQPFMKMDSKYQKFLSQRKLQPNECSLLSNPGQKFDIVQQITTPGCTYKLSNHIDLRFNRPML